MFFSKKSYKIYNSTYLNFYKKPLGLYNLLLKLANTFIATYMLSIKKLNKFTYLRTSKLGNTFNNSSIILHRKYLHTDIERIIDIFSSKNRSIILTAIKIIIYAFFNV